MDRIIFLDFDGVLNSTRWSALRPVRSLLPPDSVRQALEEERLDPLCVARVQRLVSETNACVVVTSSWRLKMPLSEMVAMFSLYGFSDAPLVDVTPVLGSARGREVTEWLKSKEDEKPCYVCLDDGGDFAGHPLAQTNPDMGVQDEDVEACRAALTHAFEIGCG